MLAPPPDSLRWHGDVSVAIDQITPRQFGPPCYADPSGRDYALGRRSSVRDSQATGGEVLPIVSQVDAEGLGQAAGTVAQITRDPGVAP